MSSFSDTDVRLDLLRQRAFNLRWAEQPQDVIPLTAADPDFPTAPAIREAIVRYVQDGVLSYGPAQGLPIFRESVANYLRTKRGAPVDASGVIAVNSAAAGLAMVARQWLTPGDEAIVMDPVDFLFAHTVRSAGGVPVRWSVHRTGALDLDRLESLITPRTRMIGLCNPHNPLGRCFTREELTAIGRLAERHGLGILSDEIWSEIVYPPMGFTSMLSLDEPIAARTVVVHGFSKSFGLAGLRIGYVAVRDAAVSARMLGASEHPSTVDGAATVSQVGAAAAYDHALPWLGAFLNHLRARRDQAVEALNAMPGVHVQSPDATYVAFAKVSDPPNTIEDLVDRLRREHGVAVVPGSPRWFGEGAAGHLRVCFATSEGILREGLDRMARGITSIRERTT
ncbi:MAG: pyridoxal phosphate-dependent aminotransferase [Bacteroidia bacterium]|nr:pyridoxal phosphate-dependent aminotransferase [Bacteroidia bacterium]